MDILSYPPELIYTIRTSSSLPQISRDVIDLCKSLQKTACTSMNQTTAPKSWRDLQSISKPPISPIEKLKKDLGLCLNKLSKSNKSVIQSKVHMLLEQVDVSQQTLILDFFLNKIFVSATVQLQYCGLYAELCKFIIKHFPPEAFQQAIQKSIQLHKSNLDACRKECTTDNYEEFCDNLQWKNKHIGFYHLLTELYKSGLIEFQDFLRHLDGIGDMIQEDTNTFKLEVLVEAMIRILNSACTDVSCPKQPEKDIYTHIHTMYVKYKTTMNMRSSIILEKALKTVPIKIREN